MKSILKGAVVLVAALALAGCYWTPQDQTSSITLRLSGTGSDGAELQAVNGDAARVYLLVISGNTRSIVDLDSGSDAFYRQVTLSGGSKTETIENVSPGRNYKLFISAGNLGDDGYLDVAEYYESGTFSPSAGSEVTFDTGNADGTGAVNLERFTTEYISVFDALRRESVTSVLRYNNRLFAATADSVYRFENVDDSGTSWSAGDRTINSISRGSNAAEPILVNTDQGIYTRGEQGSLTEYTTNMQNDVLTSIEIGFASGNGAGFGLIYQTETGIGGAYDTAADAPDGVGDAPADDWFFEDLQNQISGRPILDLTIDVANSQAFVASKIGTFGATPEILSNLEGDADFSSIQSELNFVDLPSQVLAVDYEDVSETTGRVFLGTRNGAYTVPTDTSGSFTNAPTLIEGTQGDRVTDVAVVDADTYAFLTPFYVLVTYAGETTRVPFAAGLPGEPTGIVWMGSGTLAVSGTDGLVTLSVGDL